MSKITFSQKDIGTLQKNPNSKRVSALDIWCRAFGTM